MESLLEMLASMSDSMNPVASSTIDKLAELNFKTNQDGSAKVPEIPQGRIEIQVVAKGWHTFGQWYDVDTAEQTIQIKLAPPPHWY
jgi:hypothetical protein